jgi:hypothetical protein
LITNKSSFLLLLLLLILKGASFLKRVLKIDLRLPWRGNPAFVNPVSGIH